jgi:hypothetical protein
VSFSGAVRGAGRGVQAHRGPTFLLAGQGWAEADLRAMMAPLVTEYLGTDTLAGVQDFLGAVGSMVAIALGVLCGYPLYRSLAGSFGWLRDLGSG